VHFGIIGLEAQSLLVVGNGVGHPAGHLRSSGDGSFQAYGLAIVAEDRDKIVAGVTYGIKPVNTDATYRWQVSDQFVPVKLRE